MPRIGTGAPQRINTEGRIAHAIAADPVEPHRPHCRRPDTPRLVDLGPMGGVRRSVAVYRTRFPVMSKEIGCGLGADKSLHS
jgi:hypothetical protein